MPTYDFKCKKCGNVFEDTKRMADPNPRCPKTLGQGFSGDEPMGEVTCGGETDVSYSRVPPAHFHGGGWAADKYGSVKPSMTVNQMIDRGGKP